MQRNFAESVPRIIEQIKADATSADWHVYILRCADDTFYTGITTDLKRRLKEHNSPGGGARYTRHRRPVRIVYTERAACRGAACRREYVLKQFSRTQKEKLIESAGDTPSACPP